MPQSNEELVLKKLDQILRVLTMGLTKGLKQKEQILLLDRAGFQPKEIADLLGTTTNSVSPELSRLRKVAAKPGTAGRAKGKRN